MKELMKIFDLTVNETKVYEALLKIKRGTKTPIVRASGILSSKVYEVLDRLIKKGLVASFVENKVKNYVPVHPSNVKSLFDEKIQEIKDQKEAFEQQVNKLFPDEAEFVADVQLFRGWKGMKSAFNITNEDLKEKDTYYILGANPGEDVEKANEFFSKNDKRLFAKRVKIRAVHDIKLKKEAESYLERFGRKNWKIKYYPTSEPFQIGITNNYAILILLEKSPVAILINNRKIRDSFLNYFNTLWKLAKV